MDVSSNTFAYDPYITSEQLPPFPIVTHNPAQPTLAGFQLCGLGSSRFARRY